MNTTTFRLESVTKVIGLEKVESTQQVARLLAGTEEHGTLVLSCYQTAAFDRNGKNFPAPEGGIYFTLLLKPAKPLELENLTFAGANAVADTLKKVFELKTKLTPEGDILVWDKNARKYKKIAGVLAETDEQGTYLLGVGIFVNNSLPAAYKETTISLKTIIGSETSKELFLDDVLNNFWKEYALL
jgi:BirA family biotin operon repressor/biotin-[acetyl-CoA-carboxylase] ligase